MLTGPQMLTQDRETVVLPRKADRNSHARLVTLDILKVLEFNTQTLKSGALVRARDADPNSALLFLRGAPGVIKRMVGNQSVPTDFDQVHDGGDSGKHNNVRAAILASLKLLYAVVLDDNLARSKKPDKLNIILCTVYFDSETPDDSKIV